MTGRKEVNQFFVSQCPVGEEFSGWTGVVGAPFIYLWQGFEVFPVVVCYFVLRDAEGCRSALLASQQ
jgi:hypothetical protein